MSDELVFDEKIEKLAFKDGFIRADANKAYEEIRKYGEMTPENVLKAARNPDSVLHRYIEWDVEKASYEYQLIQARRIIRKFVIVPKQVKPDEVTHPPRAFQISSERSVFKPRTFFIENRNEYQILLERAIKELKSFQARYSEIVELEAVFEAINEL